MNRAKIEDTLLAMGVPAGIKGFNYIADAIQIFDERGTNTSITKELYPAVAKKNNTTPSRVERAISHAFERVRSCGGNPEIVNHYMELRRRLGTRQYRRKETYADMGGNVPVEGYVL